MREQLVALAKLGRIDASTCDLDSKLKSLPAEVDELRDNVTVLEGLLAKERVQLADAEKLRDDQDVAIKEAQETLAKAKAKSAKARNAREVDAVERELEAVRRGMRERETEREKLIAAIAKVAESLAKHEQEFGGLKDMLAQKEAEAQQEIAAISAERDKALTGRSEILQGVPAPIARRYEMVRKRVGFATADCVEGTCMGCRMSLRPMQIIAIQRVASFEECPHCKRFLVDPGWLKDEAVPPVKSSKDSSEEA